MSSNPEDVGIRLSPQGLEDVSAALKKVLGDINRVGREGAKGLNPLKSVLQDLKSLLPAIGVAAAVSGMLGLARSSLAAADAAGKAAIKFGTTSETITTLQFAAKGANVENAQLEIGFTQLTKSLGELNAETKEQVDAFARLGLQAKDFQSLDIGESFVLVAEKMAAIPNSAVKTRTALDIFGKQAVDLIPLLNDLGTKGFDSVRKEAERFGLVIDSETAAAAAAVNDSFTLIGAQARGLATQFVSGLAPTVATIMEDFREDVAGKGVTAAEEFGEGVGRVIRNVVFFFQHSGRLIAKWAADIVAAAVNIGENAKLIATLNFSELSALEDKYQAERVGRQKAFEEDISDLIDQRIESEKRAAKLVSDAKNKSAEREKLLKDLQDLETRQALEKKREQESAKAAREREKLEKAAAQLAKERAEAEEKSQEAILELNQQLLKSRGQNRDAAVQELDAQIAKQTEIIAKAGELNAETAALLGQVKQFGTLQIDFSQLGNRIQDEFKSFEQAREQIESDAQAGIITQLEGERRIIDLEKSRLPILKELIAELQKQALLLGDPEAIAKAEQLNLGVQEIERSLLVATDTAARFRTAGLDSFQTGIEDVLNNLEDFSSVEDVFKSLASTVANSLRRMAAEMLAAAIRAQALKFILGAFGGGGATAGASVGAAAGGYIVGPGTETSDSIPARLSRGEFVMRAAAVKQPGVLPFLAYLNRNLRVPERGVPRFAAGGLVGNAPTAASGGRLRSLRVVNVLSESTVTDAMASSAGEEVVINHIEKNVSRLGRLFGGR